MAKARPAGVSLFLENFINAQTLQIYALVKSNCLGKFQSNFEVQQINNDAFMRSCHTNFLRWEGLWVEI
jgi:hypothetical protein